MAMTATCFEGGGGGSPETPVIIMTPRLFGNGEQGWNVLHEHELTIHFLITTGDWNYKEADQASSEWGWGRGGGVKPARIACKCSKMKTRRGGITIIIRLVIMILCIIATFKLEF